MTVETRPALDGIPDDQRTLALAHWYTWRLLQEHTAFRLPDEKAGYRCDGHLIRPIGWAVDERYAPARALGVLEQQMQPMTLTRLAQARTRYFREIRP